MYPIPSHIASHIASHLSSDIASSAASSVASLAASSSSAASSNYPAPNAPPPYQAQSGATASPFLADYFAQERPPSYVVSAINVPGRLMPGGGVNRDRAIALRETFLELFEGTVSGFGLFDQAASTRFLARPADARRLMDTIDTFDRSIAALFNKLPAIEKCLKRGKPMPPVIGQMIDALGPVERELAHWVSPRHGMPYHASEQDNLAIDACVQDLRDDLRAINVALQRFDRFGTLADETDVPRRRAKAGCTVM